MRSQMNSQLSRKLPEVSRNFAATAGAGTNLLIRKFSVADWEFTGTGDLDECNGMTVDGEYGYYVTDSYPWILACLTGAPDASFRKF